MPFIFLLLARFWFFFLFSTKKQNILQARNNMSFCDETCKKNSPPLWHALEGIPHFWSWSAWEVGSGCEAPGISFPVTILLDVWGVSLTVTILLGLWVRFFSDVGRPYFLVKSMRLFFPISTPVLNSHGTLCLSYSKVTLKGDTHIQGAVLSHTHSGLWNFWLLSSERLIVNVINEIEAVLMGMVRKALWNMWVNTSLS